MGNPVLPALPTEFVLPASPIFDMRNADCFDMLASLPDASVDSVIIDPPYGILKGHKIETTIDKPRLFAEFWRVMKPNTFLAFFGQMPTIVEWYLEAVKAGFKFRLDVVWAKRSLSSPLQKVVRTKEYIYIFSKLGGEFFETKEPYEDIRAPMLELALINVESIKRHIQCAHTGNRSVKRTKKQNDDLWDFGEYTGDRAPEKINITDIWSFTPENKVNRGSNNHKHPTVKPTKLVSRLAKLITPPNGLILDCFLGSGTTAVASVIDGFGFVGCELDKEYFDICMARVQEAREQTCLPF